MALRCRRKLAIAAGPLALESSDQCSVNKDVIKVASPAACTGTPPGNFCISSRRGITARTITIRSFFALRLQRC